MNLRWTGFLLLFLFATSSLAMKPGPTLIIQCPESDIFVHKSTLSSGNTFSGERWSDGYTYYPMLPSQPQITRCGDRGKFFWVAEATVVGEINWRNRDEIPQAWHQATYMRFLSEQEYFAALAEGMGRTCTKEIYLRTQAWWIANDAIRNHHMGTPALKGDVKSPFLPGTQARDNLDRLVELLDTSDPYDPFTKAEALRQLGRFDEARHTLQATFQDEREEVPNWLRDQMKKEDEETRQYLLVEYRKSNKKRTDEMEERTRWFLGLVEKRDVLVRRMPTFHNVAQRDPNAIDYSSARAFRLSLERIVSETNREDRLKKAVIKSSSSVELTIDGSSSQAYHSSLREMIDTLNNSDRVKKFQAGHVAVKMRADKEMEETEIPLQVSQWSEENINNFIELYKEKHREIMMEILGGMSVNDVIKYGEDNI